MKTARFRITVLAPLPLIIMVLGFSAAALSLHAQPFQPEVLHNFTSGGTPLAPLVLAPDGNFYGTTQTGGRSGHGIVFRMTPAGAITTLVDFNGGNGQSPSSAPLVADDADNLYGTTVHGGMGGRGIVFKVTLGGVLTPLVHFDGVNGAVPFGLVLDDSGNLYGTTITSAADSGSIFRIGADGTFTTLFRFPPRVPPGMLIRGRDGHLYGRTYNGLSDVGTVYRFSSDGIFTTLAVLSGCPNAYSTFLTEGNDGNFYATTMAAGTSNVGTALRISTEGHVTTLLHFNWSNGALPVGPLTLGLDGNLYGATMYGGVYEGTAFRMTHAGELTTLAHFTARATGVRPYGGVTFGTDGNLYGTTATGGSTDRGTAFRIQLPVIPDTDGDGVPDNLDQCADTQPAALVNAHGCSLDQLLPCSGWNSHGEYLAAATAHLAEFVAQGLLTPEQAHHLYTAAAQSDCGKKRPKNNQEQKRRAFSGHRF